MDQGQIVADSPARDILNDSDLLERVRLEALILTRLFQALSQDGRDGDQRPVNIEEATDLLERMQAGRQA